MSSSINERLERVEAENREQSGKLQTAVDLLKRIDLALTGDGERGITGIVATAKSAHRRLDEAEEERTSFERVTLQRFESIEAAAHKERWMGRIGSGVVGATVAGCAAWLKHKFGIGE